MDLAWENDEFNSQESMEEEIAEEEKPSIGKLGSIKQPSVEIIAPDKFNSINENDELDERKDKDLKVSNFDPSKNFINYSNMKGETGSRMLDQKANPTE